MENKPEERKPETPSVPQQDVQPMQPEELQYKAKPEVLPEPTYWPFFLAAGITFLCWGLISTWIISAGGLLISMVALVKWIGILRKEK